MNKNIHSSESLNNLKARLFSDPLVRLETATELIADQISDLLTALGTEEEKISPDFKLIEKYNKQIGTLVKKQLFCYHPDFQVEIINNVLKSS